MSIFRILFLLANFLALLTLATGAALDSEFEYTACPEWREVKIQWKWGLISKMIIIEEKYRSGIGLRILGKLTITRKYSSANIWFLYNYPQAFSLIIAVIHNPPYNLLS